MSQMSQIEATVLAVSAVLAAGVLWVPAVCLIRRALRRRRMRRADRAGRSVLDIIGRR
jgi:hypothetical protein